MLWLIYIMLTDILWLICWLILCWILKNNVCWLIYHTLKNIVKAIHCFVDCIETTRAIGNIATEQFFCCCKFLKLLAWSLSGVLTRELISLGAATSLLLCIWSSYILYIEEACVCSPEACIAFTLAETVDLQGYCVFLFLFAIIVNYTNSCKRCNL